MESPLSDEVDGSLFSRAIELIRGNQLISEAELERKAIAHALAEADKAVKLPASWKLSSIEMAEMMGGKASALQTRRWPGQRRSRDMGG